jgi:type VI protein secretion system component VasK
VAQPATISSVAAAEANRVTRKRREQAKMLWFFLEALVALLIALAIVGWTMGFGRRRPRNKRADADRDRNL